MIAGIVFHSGLRRTPNNQSTPFCSGMCQSSTMILGSVLAACIASRCACASSALAAVVTMKPQASSCEARISTLIALSSTTSTRVPGASMRPCDESEAMAGAAGSVTASEKVEPTPGWLTHEMSPPMSVASCRLIASPESRAAEAARGRAVFLHEGVEDRRLVFRQDAGAGVDHVDDQRDVRFRRIHAARAHQHVAGGGELERVRHEVHEDLADAQLVALGPAMQVRIDVEQQLDALLVRALREQVDDFFHHLADVEVLRLEAQLAGFDLREVENVVDDREQRVRRALDRRRETALARIELRIEQQFRHAEHAVHRRADLVRHAREEFALRAARGFGGAAGFDAVVHRLAQRLVRFGEALGALDDFRLELLRAGAPAPARGISILPEHAVEAAHQVPISSSLVTCARRE